MSRRGLERDSVTAAMAWYGWNDLWYANPFASGTIFDDEKARKFGPRWVVGIWTGPELDLLCLKRCDTNEEAELWLSPSGWTPEEAVALATAKYEKLSARRKPRKARRR